jgi:hypothetical protein
MKNTSWVLLGQGVFAIAFDKDWMPSGPLLTLRSSYAQTTAPSLLRISSTETEEKPVHSDAIKK